VRDGLRNINEWCRRMSIALMTAAFKAKLNHTHKFVLVALCDNANDQGECYPSISMLCEKTSLSDRAVQKSIAFLVDAKFLRRDIRNGRSTYYFIADPASWPNSTPEPCSPRTTFTPNGVHPTPEPHSPQPPNGVHPTPERGSPITINESSVEPSKKQSKPTAFVLPAWIPAEAWGAFVEMRKQRKKLPTAYACKLIVDDLEKIRDAGHDIEVALKNSIKNGWTDVYAPKPNQSARASPAKPEKFDPLTYMKNKREALAKNERTIQFDANGEPL
jgi:hypothetical protein